MIRATALRALALTAVFAAALAPVMCLGQDGKPDGKKLPAEETKKSPSKETNKLPAKATKKLTPELLALLQQKKMAIHSPILVRIFKEEAELEVWKQELHRPFRAPQDLSDLPVVGRSGAEVPGGRPARLRRDFIA